MQDDGTFGEETADVLAKIASTYIKERRLSAARYWLNQALKASRGTMTDTIIREQVLSR